MMQGVRPFCSQSVGAGLYERMAYLDQSPGLVVESKRKRIRGVLRKNVMAAPGTINLSWRSVCLETAWRRGLSMTVVDGDSVSVSDLVLTDLGSDHIPNRSRPCLFIIST